VKGIFYKTILKNLLAFMEPKTPNNFSSPNEREIIKLEKQYSNALAEGKVFEVLKNIRNKIKLLKSELSTRRDKV
jgi:flagellar biosynthesis regulator FlbT